MVEVRDAVRGAGKIKVLQLLKFKVLSPASGLQSSLIRNGSTLRIWQILHRCGQKVWSCRRWPARPEEGRGGCRLHRGERGPSGGDGHILSAVRLEREAQPAINEDHYPQPAAWRIAALRTCGCRRLSRGTWHHSALRSCGDQAEQHLSSIATQSSGRSFEQHLQDRVCRAPLHP